MRRRQFIRLVGGVVVGSPLAVRAQQGERVRRVGILFSIAEGDYPRSNLAAFYKGLQQLGWSDGRNVRFDERWGASDADRIRKLAAELVGLARDVILSVGPGSWPS